MVAGNDIVVSPMHFHHISHHLLSQYAAQALTWRDNKFVKMLSSMYITNGKFNVPRYVRVFN